MGKRKIVISERDNLAALFDDEQAIEFIINRGDMLLGDVYLATVENILPSIDAAFVNVGGDKMGFLHSSDVQGKGDLKTRLQPKQQLVVQVMKEPTGHKGPRVTTNISLPGRFLVLMPESRGISISRKIEQQSERARLKSVVSLIKPPGVGVIIRTEANLQKESDIQEDFELLLERWQSIVAMADSATPPTLLYRDQDLLYRVIREAVTDDVKEIVVDTNFGLQRAQQLLQNWNMDKNIKVSLYSGNQSILIALGVDREIKLALQTKVPLPSGGYLYIQPTEALTVVDVNSGKFTSLQSQADTIRQTNLEATREIARQLRLRNVGGMIIVDFIDMESRADKLTILEAFENELAPDKAKPQIGQLSDLGLVEMTRHRQGQALSEMFSKRCIACNGTGHGLEEFNWAPPQVDGDPRATARPGSNRSKLPIRQTRYQQGQQNNQNQKGHQGGGPGNRAASALMDVPKPNLNKPAQQTEGFLQNRNRQQQATPSTPPPQIDPPPNKGNQQGGQANQGNSEEKLLHEFYRDRLIEKYNLRFASTGKFAFTPPGINSILIRINPKSNDIFTLIQSMEANGSEPFLSRMLPDDDEFGDASETAQETPPAAVALEARPTPQIAPDTEELVEVPTLLSYPVERSVVPVSDSELTPEEESPEDDERASETARAPRRGRARQLQLVEDSVEETNEELLEENTAGDEDDEAEKPKQRRRGRPPKRATAKSIATTEESTATASDEDDESEAPPRRGGRRTSTSVVDDEDE